jgi:hypothetical protein
MTAAIEKLLYSLTNKSNIEEIDVEELSQLANEHPYFAPAQLALAAKLKADNSYRSDTQLQKTLLYFSNVNWFQYQTINGGPKEIKWPQTQQEVSSIVEDTQVLQPQPVKQEPIIETPPPVIPQEKIEPTPTPSLYNFNIPTIESVREMLQGVDKRESSEEETKPISNHLGLSSYAQAFNSPETPAAPTLEVYGEAISSPYAPTQPASSFTETKEEFAPEIEEEEESEQESPLEQGKDFSQKLSSVLSTQVTNFNKPVQEDAKLEFEGEPYYTIDYFASQGIKADLYKQPQDNLSKQLLKFTDWLKRMKTETTNPQDLGTDPELENAIKGIAQTSNEAKEIVTETMAEVFIKQGKIDKAVQLYIKLSFLEPEKSAYFAAKIQQLKGI